MIEICQHIIQCTQYERDSHRLFNILEAEKPLNNVCFVNKKNSFADAYIFTYFEACLVYPIFWFNMKKPKGYFTHGSSKWINDYCCLITLFWECQCFIANLYNGASSALFVNIKHVSYFTFLHSVMFITCRFLWCCYHTII